MSQWEMHDGFVHGFVCLFVFSRAEAMGSVCTWQNKQCYSLLGRKRFPSLSLFCSLSPSFTFSTYSASGLFCVYTHINTNPVWLICVAFCRHESPSVGELAGGSPLQWMMQFKYYLSFCCSLWCCSALIYSQV